MDKLRIMNQIKPKYRKWTAGVTRTIDKDKCNRSVIDPYDYEPLQGPSPHNTKASNKEENEQERQYYLGLQEKRAIVRTQKT